ncbi:MAG: zinc ribbon domain-containing protein [Gemmatimonadota bacterium]
MTDHALYDLLMRRLEETGVPPEAGIGVAELHRRLIPYSLCRESLALATKAEYDLALLRLLADESRIRVPELALREAVRRELETPEPALGILHRFAASEVRPAGAPRPTPAPPPAAHPGQAATAAPRERRPPAADLETERRSTDRIPGLDDLELLPDPPGERRTREPVAGAAAAAAPASSDAAAGRCRACRASLPSRDGLRFCPGCGADQDRWACHACGAEVERDWRYCAMCGTLQPR